jgi:GH35 family endo-1,4-beta-xylanase
LKNIQTIITTERHMKNKPLLVFSLMLFIFKTHVLIGQPELQNSGLKDLLFNSHLKYIGFAMSGNWEEIHETEKYKKITENEFNIMTCDNETKPNRTQPQRVFFDFYVSD